MAILILKGPIEYYDERVCGWACGPASLNFLRKIQAVSFDHWKFVKFGLPTNRELGLLLLRVY